MSEKMNLIKPEKEPKIKFFPIQKIIPEIDLHNFQSIRPEDQDKKFGMSSENYSWGLYKYYIEPLDSREIFDEVDDTQKERALAVGKALRDLKGQIVVDLGASKWTWIYKIANKFKAKAYVGVDIWSPSEYGFEEDAIYNKISSPTVPVSLVQEDMLTFLRRLPDNSVSVIACGIDETILSMGRKYGGPDDFTYRDAVSKEIIRVLDPKGLFLNDNHFFKLEEINNKINRQRVWETNIYTKKLTKK